MEYNNSRFAQQLMLTVTLAHWLHFRTTSYAKHMALGDFYEELQDHADKFIETSITTYGPLDGANYVDINFNTADPIKSLRNFNTLLAEAHGALDNPGLINVLEDIMTLTQQTLYKLENLN